MEAVIKLTALSKDYFKVGWNNFDLFIVVLSLPDLAIYFGKLEDVPGVSQLAGIVKIFRLVCDRSFLSTLVSSSKCSHCEIIYQNKADFIRFLLLTDEGSISK